MNGIIKKSVSVILMLVLISFVSLQCTDETDPSAELKITINSWIGWAPLYLAIEKDLLGDADLIITRVEDTGARKSTMMAGHVDGYASSVDNFALDSAEGVPGKIILCFDESYGGDGIVAKKNIESLEDLKGRDIAFQKGLPSHFLLLYVLKLIGLSPNDITQIDMDADKAGAAFTGGRLDAAVTWEPWLSKANEMADGYVLTTTKEYPGLIVDVLVFRPDVLAEKEHAVQDVISGWFKALDFWNANKDESDNIMANAYGLEVTDFRAMCEGVRFYDLKRNLEYFGENNQGPIFEVFSSASSLWIEANIIKNVKNPVDVIDPSFINSLK
ncbi:ABC transporter substrate-binding protein [candidate division KSB1 bacterium]